MCKSKAPVMGYAVQEVEWLMATYSMSCHYATWEHPRMLTLVLMPAYAERQGHKAMMSYTDRASAAAREQVGRWIAANFDVVDASPAEIGWRLGKPPAFMNLPQ